MNKVKEMFFFVFYLREKKLQLDMEQYSSSTVLKKKQAIFILPV
jgi:hypothetical protein